MPNVISWKKSEIASLRAQMEDLFDHFFHRLSRSCQESGLMTLADWQIEEDDQRLLLKLQVPDMLSENIEVTLTEDTLAITLKKEYSEACSDADLTHRERTYQALTHSVRVAGNVKRDDISARYANGVLTIELPKAEKRVYKIPVKD
jgi:HSP20 family protein